MRTTHRFAILGVLGLMCAALALVAQADSTPFVLKGFSNTADGTDRVFQIDVQNTTNQDLVAHGRLVAISVYDATPATVMGIANTVIKAGETKHFTTRWVAAPFVGRVRTLLVMSDGTDPSLVTSSDFWILPIKSTLIALGCILLVIVLVLTLMRLPVYLRERVPENMVAYRVEPGDSVVTLANRYNETWQDIAKANKLKPPYEIKPGKRIFIPRHGLLRPKEPPTSSPKP